jgi:hypothetical protein
MLKIYNEDESVITIHDVTAETELLCILEIQGIKFTSRSFQLEIEIKQAMVIHDEPIFESCLIKTNKKANKQVALDDVPIAPLGKIMLQDSFVKPEPKEPKEPNEPKENIKISMEEPKQDVVNADTIKKDEGENKDKEEENKDKEEGDKAEEEEEEEEEEDDYDYDDDDDDDEDYKPKLTIDDSKEVNKDELDFFDLNEEKEEESKDDLKELDFSSDLNDSLETVKLKKPNEVYFEMYKEARNKAKNAKKAAILAYLEAKNIKKTYMLDNINDSDSEIDAEIDEVTESELEGL